MEPKEETIEQVGDIEVVSETQMQRVDHPQADLQANLQSSSPVVQAAALMAQSGGKIDVATLKELLAMQREHEANEARKAYVVAMAAFKENSPVVVKDKTVSYTTDKGTTTYKHAKLGEATTVINRALSAHGLTAAWRTEQEGSIKVTCIVTHTKGHSEQTSLSAGADGSGGKNAIQAIKSTVTYLQRTTLFTILGIAPHDEDDDGNASGRKPKPEISQPNDQEKEIIAQIAMKIPAPDKMRVDPTKLYPVLWQRGKGRYPGPANNVDEIAVWLAEMDLKHIFVPDNRSDFEKEMGFTGDEDSQPDNEAEETAAKKFGEENDQKPLRWRCEKCAREFEHKKNGGCPTCFWKKIIDQHPPVEPGEVPLGEGD